MRSALFDPKVKRVLESMHKAADENDPPLLAKAHGKQGAARTSLLSEAFIPVSRDGGRLVYTLVRGASPGTTVEFGTSFGISTIYMAAAVRDRGAGQVITTELEQSKADRARKYITDAGLMDVVDLRVGDALETLKDLDADDIHLFPDALKAYLDYVREPKNGYVSVTFPEGDAVELSVRAR